MTPRAPAMSADERRAALVASTVPLLQSRGPAISTRDIAKAAGVAEGTIFRVFDSKDDLIRSCVESVFDTTALRRELRAIDRDQPLEQRLVDAVEVVQAHLRGVFALITTLHTAGKPFGSHPHPHPDPGQHRAAQDEVDDDLVAVIGDEDAARLRVSPEQVARHLRLLTLANAHPMLGAGRSSAEDIVDLVLHGVLEGDRA